MWSEWLERIKNKMKRKLIKHTRPNKPNRTQFESSVRSNVKSSKWIRKSQANSLRTGSSSVSMIYGWPIHFVIILAIPLNFAKLRAARVSVVHTASIGNSGRRNDRNEHSQEEICHQDQTNRAIWWNAIYRRIFHSDVFTRHTVLYACHSRSVVVCNKQVLSRALIWVMLNSTL